MSQESATEMVARIARAMVEHPDEVSAGIGEDRGEAVVFLVDDVPVAMSAPGSHGARWSLSPGKHTIVAVLANQALRSEAVTINVTP